MTSNSSAAERYFFLGLLAIVTVLFLWILKAYLLPILWAVVFAILLYPVFKFVRRGVGNASLASALTMILAIVCIFAPLSLIGFLLADNAVSIYQEASTEAPAYIDAVVSHPQAQRVLGFLEVDLSEIETMIIDSTREASAWIAAQIFSIGARTLGTVVKLFLMMYLLFFFLKDGKKILERLERVVALGGGREKALFERFASTVKAIFNGTIVIAIVQGILGGILFWTLGIDNFVLWGSIMAFLSIIPAVGPSLVWLPASIVFFATGSVTGGLILIGGGVFISLVDNLLKPVLVGRSTKMPDALILISIFGGIVTFGIAGVILGPVIAALFLSAWQLFADEYGRPAA